MYTDLMEALGVFIFCKDRHGKYVHANELLAQAAGLDSPSQIINKTDDDLIWASQAKQFQQGDKAVFNGYSFVDVQETQIQPNKIATIVTTKILDCTESHSPRIMGGYRDITAKQTGKIILPNKCLRLGPQFDNITLSYHEVETLKLIIRGLTSKVIAKQLCKSEKCIEYRTKILRQKLQCKTKKELVALAMDNGLTFHASDPVNWL